MVSLTGLEPALASLEDWCIIHYATVSIFFRLAEDTGLEPVFTEPKSVVLPLNESSKNLVPPTGSAPV